MNQRTIKFRAWDGEKMWFNQFCVTAQGYIQRSEVNREWHSWKNEDWIIEQFTGLLDKNGKEIYEGDVIACPPLFEGDKPYFVVEWNRNEHGSMWGWMQRNATTGLGVLDDSILEKGTVIGNIHEHGHLL